jgi:hypothetical protein
MFSTASDTLPDGDVNADSTVDLADYVQGVQAVLGLRFLPQQAADQGNECVNSRTEYQPVSFEIGTERVMPGWSEGVIGIQKSLLIHAVRDIYSLLSVHDSCI